MNNRYLMDGWHLSPRIIHPFWSRVQYTQMLCYAMLTTPQRGRAGVRPSFRGVASINQLTNQSNRLNS